MTVTRMSATTGTSAAGDGRARAGGLSRLLPPAGPARLLAAAQLANAVGDGAYYVTSALYFTRVVGLSTAQVGVGLTVSWAVGTLAGVPLGNLADRRGAKGIAIVLALATAAAIGGYLLVGSLAAFVAVACVYAAAQCGLDASRQALLAALVPPAARTRVRAYLQSTVNGGLAVGAGLGGVALRFDSRPAYLTVLAVDAVAFVACAVVLTRLPAVPRATRRTGEPLLAVLHDRPYALITLLNTVLLLRMPLLSVALPLWVAERTSAPRWLAAVLFVLNAGAVLLLQVRVAGRVHDLRGATRTVRLSGVVLLLACGAFALSAFGAPWYAAAALVVAGGLLVVGEMLQSAGSWEVGFGLAPADRQGQYQGFFGSGVAVARMIGPVLLTTLLLGGGAAGWLVLGALFLVAGVLFSPATRWAERQISGNGSVG